MKPFSAPVLLAGLVLLLLVACGGPAAQPLAFTPPPWSDGEVSSYDVIGRDAAPLGAASWTWRSAPAGWRQAYELSLAGRADRGEVVVGPDLHSLRSWRELSGKRFEAEYGADAITITTTGANGKGASKTLKPAADAVDNDVSLQAQRALPLAAGYSVGYTDVIPTTGSLARVRLTVTGAETITVPAGTFPAWRVEMDFGSGKHDAWYGQEAPHPLVKYVNRGSGAAFVLRSLGTGQPAPAAGSAGNTPGAPQDAAASQDAVASASKKPSPIGVPMLLSSLLIQLPLMVAFPIVLGWWIRRRYGVGWGIFWAGALTFVASQVVHLPLNYALGLLGGGRGVALWPLPMVALVAGLSAGVCEEGARWITLRFFLKRARGWRPGLQFGAGHGVVSAHRRRRRAAVRHHHPDRSGRGGDALVHAPEHRLSVRRHRPAHAGGFLGRLGHGDAGDGLGRSRRGGFCRGRVLADSAAAGCPGRARRNAASRAGADGRRSARTRALSGRVGAARWGIALRIGRTTND